MRRDLGRKRHIPQGVKAVSTAVLFCGTGHPNGAKPMNRRSLSASCTCTEHLLPSEIPGGEKPQPMRESQPKWPKQLKNVKQFWQSFYRQFFFKIMGWLHLERIFEIIMSSCYPSTTPDPKCHILQIPPWMVTPPLPWTAHCSAQQPFGRRNAF